MLTGRARREVHVQRNMARLHNNRCHGKATGDSVLFFFSHYLMNGTRFVGGLLNIKCMLWFSVQLSSETTHSKKNSVRYYYKCP
jgi:hypothetical protein